MVETYLTLWCYPGPRATHPPPFYLWGSDKGTILRASSPTFRMWPCKHFSHIQVLVPNFFPTLPRKLNPGGQVGRRLQIATHLDQSNYLANQKQGAVNKYNFIVFIRLFEGSESCLFFRVSSGFTGFDWWASSKTSCAGGDILSIGGDALNEAWLMWI
jgi:hypothetical protein